MDHAEAVELIEIAAAEPDGLVRLAAGDTPEAVALIGHVAGCAACAAEFETLRRVATATRATLADEPSPGLRDRTLAYVAALGRERAGDSSAGSSAGMAAASATDGAVAPAGGAEAASAGPDHPRPMAGPETTAPEPTTAPRWPRPSWMGLAAAVMVAALAGGLIVGSVQQLAFEQEAAPLYSLARVNEEAVRIAAAPDAVTVALAAPAGSSALGSLVFSGASGELAVMASGLPEPDDGWEYRCWVETAGVREQIGGMTLGEGLAYWAGPSDGLDVAGPGSTFGVSLVRTDAAGGGDPVLLGQVEAGDS